MHECNNSGDSEVDCDSDKKADKVRRCGHAPRKPESQRDKYSDGEEPACQGLLTWNGNASIRISRQGSPPGMSNVLGFDLQPRPPAAATSDYLTGRGCQVEPFVRRRSLRCVNEAKPAEQFLARCSYDLNTLAIAGQIAAFQ